jgi:hypothetical protein
MYECSCGKESQVLFDNVCPECYVDKMQEQGVQFNYATLYFYKHGVKIDQVPVQLPLRAKTEREKNLR